jgi:hypothetical protein
MPRLVWASTLIVGLFASFPLAAEFPVELAPGQRLVGRLGAGPAAENSGIVRSRNHDNVFWMHNDSGDEARIYAVRRDGSVYPSERYPDTPGTLIGGAINCDWEDIAMMHDGSLVVADLGNNSNARRDLVLYLLDEPEPTAGRTTFRKKLFVRYPQQITYPAPEDDFNYDCESIFTLGENIYLLTKHRSDTATRVYRLEDFTEARTHDLELLERFELGGQAVAADTLPDGSRLVVATYDTLWLFDVRDANHPLSQPIARLPFKGDNVEAVAFDGPDRVLFADEATALLYEADIADFVPYEGGAEE